MAKARDLVYLLVIAVLWPLVSSQEPESCGETITVTTNNQLVSVSPGTVCFQCDFGSGVASDSTFQINSAPVDSSEGNTVMGVLVIFAAEDVFSTSHLPVRCTSGGDTLTAFVGLEIFQPPIITGQTAVMEGDTLDLDCDASNSQPLPSVSWVNPQGEVVSDDRDIVITGISRTQSGIYTCVARDGNGETQNSTVNVTVEVNSAGPDDCNETITLVMSTGIAYVIPGIVCFQCDFGSGVATDTTFQIDSSPVDRIIGNTVRGVLVIFESDEVFGITPLTVQCTSGGDSFSLITYLKLFEPPIVSGNTTVMEGDTLSLDCDASNSQPLPTVEWFNPEGEMVSNDRDLEVTSISRTQSGMYQCVATDSDGDTRSRTVDVIVQYAPDVSATETGTQDFPLGRTVMLSCEYQGIPAPNQITWRHNGTILMDSDPDITIASDDAGTMLSRSNLAADGGGMYTCNASNVAGSGSDDISVRVQLPPGPPTNLMVEERTEGSLLLRWANPSFDGFSPIAGFRVEFRNERTMDVDENSFTGGPSTSQYNITGLSPLTEYSVSLFVRNEVELEGEAATVSGSTRSLRLSNVTDLSLQVLTSTEIRVQWSPPTRDPSTTSPVTSYEVTYQEVGTGSSQQGNSQQITVPSPALNVTLDGLNKGTRYEVTVTPFNEVGGGETSHSETAETAVDPPTTPRDFIVRVLSPFSLELSWREPMDNGGRPIATYHIELRVSGGGAMFSTVAELDGNTLSSTINDLMQDTSYEVVITAINSNGLESPNVTAVVRTDEVGPPQIPAISTPDVIATDTSIVVNWMNPGGYPNYYILQYKRLADDWNNANVTTTLNLTSTVLEQALADLQPLTDYTFRIASQNINGISVYSDAFIVGTFGEASIQGPSQTQIHSPGKAISLKCSLETTDYSPPITYMWSRENGALPEDSEVNNDTLTLTDPRFEDSGVYVCTAQGVTARFSVSIGTESDSNSSNIWIIIGAVVGTVVIVSVIIFISIICLCLCCKWHRHQKKYRDPVTSLSMKPRKY